MPKNRIKFGAGLVGHKLPTRKQWDAITRALGPGGHAPETIVFVLESYRRICGNLQECVQRHRIGLGGERIDELVVAELDRLLTRKPRRKKPRCCYCNQRPARGGDREGAAMCNVCYHQP